MYFLGRYPFALSPSVLSPSSFSSFSLPNISLDLKSFIISVSIFFCPVLVFKSLWNCTSSLRLSFIWVCASNLFCNSSVAFAIAAASSKIAPVGVSNIALFHAKVPSIAFTYESSIIVNLSAILSPTPSQICPYSLVYVMSESKPKRKSS